MLHLELNKPLTAYPSFYDLLIARPLRASLAAWAAFASRLGGRRNRISVSPMSRDWLLQHDVRSGRRLDI